jgi:hypothetical protein
MMRTARLRIGLSLTILLAKLKNNRGLVARLRGRI